MNESLIVIGNNTQQFRGKLQSRLTVHYMYNMTYMHLNFSIYWIVDGGHFSKRSRRCGDCSAHDRNID